MKITEIENSSSKDEEKEEYDLDSDHDLQEAFAQGILKPGLIVPGDTSKPKVFVNNVKGIKRKIEELHFKAPWIERLDLTNQLAPLAPELAEKMEEQQKLMTQTDTASNDFQRELNFYRQAQAAVLEGLPRLHSMGIPTRRPDDYFAQMAKTDEHMHKVREALTKKQTETENREKIRQHRSLKKFGKKVEAASRVAKAAHKKAMLDEVKKFRKGQRKDLDFLDDDDKPKPPKKKQRSDYNVSAAAGGGAKGKGTIKRSQFRREAKEQKYGQGGRKRGKKANTRESASDVWGVGNKGGGRGGAKGGKGGAGGKRGGQGAKQPRPGKGRRQKMKGRNK